MKISKQLVLFVLMSMFFSTCSNKVLSPKMPYIQTNSNPIPHISYIHDTITRDIRHMTPDQYRAYLKQVYKDGIDSLISPQFKAMSASNRTLTALMHSMFNQDIQLRTRTRRFRDSISQRSDSSQNASKRTVDSANKVANDRQEKILELTQESEKNGSSLLKELGALVLLIMIAVIILYRKVSKLGRKVDELKKTLEHE